MESGSQNPSITPPPTPRARPPLHTPYRSYTPEVPSQSRVRLVKSIWRMFIMTNFGIGAYMFLTASTKHEPGVKEGDKAPQKVEVEPPQPVKIEDPPPQPENPNMDLDFDYDFDLLHIVPSSASTEPLLPPGPIPVDQRKELFQWMLEEKRKIEPKDREEKKKIDQEKAILKQFLRAKSTPTI